MNEDQIEAKDADVPALAVEGLNAAQREAMESGHTVVFVRGNDLIEKGPHGEKILKTLPPRKQVPLGDVRIIHE